MDYTWKRRFHPLGFHKCSKSETHLLSCFESVTFYTLVTVLLFVHNFMGEFYKYHLAQICLFFSYW